VYRKVIWSVLVIFLSVSFVSSSGYAQPWEVKGEYAESCSCEKGCPCIFGSPPSHGSCEAALFFLIQEGHYGETSLNGSVLAAVLQLGPQGKVTYYIGEEASATQRAALEAIFKPMFKEIVPQELATKYVPIRVEIEGDERSLEIPNILQFKIRRVKGMLPDAPTMVINPPRHFLSQLVVAESLRYVYTDQGQNWDYAGRSGLYGTFHYASGQR